MRTLSLCLLLLWLPALHAQEFSERYLKALPTRCIGPANMSGRVCEVAVVEKNPRTMYVASASGGLWKTTNNGGDWTAVFEREVTVSLGAVAVSQSHSDVVWVGTGEANPRNSATWGDGVYKSTDGGKTWKNMGLRDTQHIGRIVIHPTNPDIVYVAALGHIWGPNKERGLYKTSDGGKTWEQSKYIDEHTGFIDVVMDPSNADVLYAAAWQIRRDGFSGGNPAVQTGPGSGLFRTRDGGKTWTKLSKGLPTNHLGRCGFDIYRRDPRIVYAVVQTELTPVPVAGQSANLKIRESKDALGRILRRPIGPDDGGIFRSDDGGETWHQLNSLVPRPFYYGQIRVDPSDVKRLYVLGINFHVSLDGGRTFLDGNAAKGTHVDYHALWINPTDSNHLVLGCDGGMNFSYDRGRTWEHLKNLPISQFYQIGVDMRKPYRVYGGLQDNGSWGGPSATYHDEGIAYGDWFRILGMDGFYCQVDPKDNDTVYAEGQYGVLMRINVRTKGSTLIKPRLAGATKGSAGNIKPPPPPGTPEFRYNWNSPILISPHDAKTLYYGSNVVFRSPDRGTTWAIVSPDLTRGQPGPSKNFGHTLTTLAESPRQQGVLYAGSDDGRVHVTHDGGKTWQDISTKIPTPQERAISRVVCSHHDDSTAYVTLTRYRNDDRAPYVFKTTDQGQTWEPLAAGLPAGGPVHVLHEDPVNPQLLYVGTEFGLYLSANGGKSWLAQRHGFPTVAVHDLVVHPRDRELIIGTHGRGIYIMPVAPLQQLAAAAGKEPYLFESQPAVAYQPRLQPTWFGTRTFLGSNPPYGAVLYYALQRRAAETPRLWIAGAEGKTVAELKLEKAQQEEGLHAVSWDLRPTKRDAEGKLQVGTMRVAPGRYTVVLECNGQTLRRPLEVLAEEKN